MKLVERTFRNHKDYYITSPFGNRINPATGVKGFHYGCDYGTHLNKYPLYPLEDGKVVSVRTGKKDKDGSGYGNYVKILYPRLKIRLFYAHLDKVNVKLNDTVNSTTVIGNVGTTGTSTGIHLHLGLQNSNSSTWLDPEKYDYEVEQELKFKVDDKVKIIDYGNSNSNGTGSKSYGIGWTRYVTKIYQGRPYPYQVGNKGKTSSKDTTGFYNDNGLEKV